MPVSRFGKRLQLDFGFPYGAAVMLNVVLRSGALLAANLLLVACQSTPTHAPAAVASCTAKTQANADDNFKAALWQQTAAEYEALSLQVYQRADQALSAALADPSWDALDATERRTAPLTTDLATVAIIADIDETLLDNSAFTVRQMREPMPDCLSPAAAKIEFDRRWLEWSLEAQAVAMPGAAEFMQRAVKQPQVEVFYISNRKDEEKATTCLNLLATGFPVQGCASHVLTRNDAEGRLKDKLSRRQMVAKQARVALLFGDNLGDFVGNVQTNIGDRAAIVRNNSDRWGTRWMVLPNPGYGSWEDVLGRVEGRADDFTDAATRTAWLRQQKEHLLKDCRERDCLPTVSPAVDRH